MIRARPSAELLTLLHELSAIAGLPGPAERPESCDWNAWFELADGNQLVALEAVKRSDALEMLGRQLNDVGHLAFSAGNNGQLILRWCARR